ncbi:MAG: hypothetical protein SA378_06270 [Sedimentibacter sp.]|uniref:hypothetical protein n=1 Tax=Sedimentibacter sp. TaxID=1960295 RepID=UPI002981B9F1|nr:hypothetical protein [Sedimentibacter sp.]MDW5299723.1 hypothetical protein [Sedimentibacter sp.]
MNNNYKVIRTIFENVFQRVLECKDNDTGEIFYSNVITSQKVINLINIEELKQISSNILECYNTEDRIYIFTKPLNTEFKKIREFLVKSLTLKQQFNLSSKVISLGSDIFNMTDAVQQKILDLDRLYIDGSGNVLVDCNLIFEQEYDIADNETFKRLGNIIHFIFAGTEIVDYNISDTIPPDILKIIVRCLTREYIFPNDVLNELKSSSIYSMIFGAEKLNDVAPSEFIEKEQQNIVHRNNFKVNQDDEENPKNYENDDSVLNIYLNNNNANEKFEKPKAGILLNKEFLRAAVSILIVVLVLLIGNFLIESFSKEKEVSAEAGNVNENQQIEESEANSDNTEVEEQQPSTSISDSTQMYLNDELIDKVEYTGSRATIDNDIYLEGQSALFVGNDSEGKVKSLFAVVDFTDEKFNYMLRKQIGIAAKIKSEKDVTVLIVLEAYKDGVITSNFHTSMNSYDDMWSQVTVPINVTDADSLNIYIEYEGQNKVWIDSINIDEIK